MALSMVSLRVLKSMHRANQHRRHGAPGRRRNSSGLVVSPSSRMVDMKNSALSLTVFTTLVNAPREGAQAAGRTRQAQEQQRLGGEPQQQDVGHEELSALSDGFYDFGQCTVRRSASSRAHQAGAGTAAAWW